MCGAGEISSLMRTLLLFNHDVLASQLQAQLDRFLLTIEVAYAEIWTQTTPSSQVTYLHCSNIVVTRLLGYAVFAGFVVSGLWFLTYREFTELQYQLVCVSIPAVALFLYLWLC